LLSYNPWLTSGVPRGNPLCRDRQLKIL